LIGKNKPFHIQVMQEYIVFVLERFFSKHASSNSDENSRFVGALRALLQSFRVPGEAQVRLPLLALFIFFSLIPSFSPCSNVAVLSLVFGVIYP
jgi:hypothetical protein